MGVRVLPESPIFFKKLPNQNFSATVFTIRNEHISRREAGGDDLGFSGGLVVEFILGRYSVLFYATLAFIIAFITAFKCVALLPVAIVLGLLAALGWHDYT